MREDTKRLRNESREFDDDIMNDKEPTSMPSWYCVECGGECECERKREWERYRDEKISSNPHTKVYLDFPDWLDRERD